MVSAQLPIPCCGKNSVSDALCGVNKQRLFRTAEDAAIALIYEQSGVLQSHQKASLNVQRLVF